MSNSELTEKSPEKRTRCDWQCMNCLFSRYRLVGSIMVVLAIGCVIWSNFASDEIQKRLVACWAIVPPIYFFGEFHWARATRTDLEFKRLKESQELATRIWAGVVTALTVLYLK